eukprot:5660093-Pyramimonas_sp.AAC.1
MGLEVGDTEERQCLLLHLAAGVLLLRAGEGAGEPSPDAVQQLAATYRLALWEEAHEALRALGDSP